MGLAGGLSTNGGAATTPSGIAGGDLSGTYPNPSVATVKTGKTPLTADQNLADVAAPATALSNLAGAPLASPAFTGNPTAPTQTLGDSSTKLATTAFVAAAVPVIASPINLVTTATNPVLANKLLSGDTNPSFQIIGTGQHKWGPGGSTATDTNLYRNGVGLLRTDGDFIVSTRVWDNTLTSNFDFRSGTIFINNADLDFQVGKEPRLTEGTNARMGVATLVGGSVTVANNTITANTRIFLEVQSLSGVSVPTPVVVTARTVNTNFTITSSSALDTSTVAYLLMEPV